MTPYATWPAAETDDAPVAGVLRLVDELHAHSGDNPLGRPSSFSLATLVRIADFDVEPGCYRAHSHHKGFVITDESDSEKNDRYLAVLSRFSRMALN